MLIFRLFCCCCCCCCWWSFCWMLFGIPKWWFFWMQRWNLTCICITLLSLSLPHPVAGTVLDCNNFEIVGSDITCVSTLTLSPPPSRLHAPNFGHTVAAFFLASRSMFLYLLWFLFVFNDHDSSYIMCCCYCCCLPDLKIVPPLTTTDDGERGREKQKRVKVLTFFPSFLSR